MKNIKQTKIDLKYVKNDFVRCLPQKKGHLQVCSYLKDQSSIWRNGGWAAGSPIGIIRGTCKEAALAALHGSHPHVEGLDHIACGTGHTEKKRVEVSRSHSYLPIQSLLHSPLPSGNSKGSRATLESNSVPSTRRPV